MPKSKTAALVPIERITDSILILRNHKVLLDADLAALYGVATKVLLQTVKRNPARFREDFMFQLSAKELAALRSHFATSKKVRHVDVRRRARTVEPLDGLTIRLRISNASSRLI